MNDYDVYVNMLATSGIAYISEKVSLDGTDYINVLSSSTGEVLGKEVSHLFRLDGGKLAKVSVVNSF